MIKFSILIPFWDLGYKDIEKMLNSIPNRNDVEVLLLDNASNQQLFRKEDLQLCDLHVLYPRSIPIPSFLFPPASPEARVAAWSLPMPARSIPWVRLPAQKK